MKDFEKGLLLIAFSFSLGFAACASIQLEGIQYTLPNGQVASCVTHPTQEGFMQCSYMDGANEVIVAIQKDMLSGLRKKD